MPKQPATNLAAAKSGDQLAALEKLRDTLAEQLDTTDAAIHAQLAAQYRATLEAIAALKPPEVSAHARFEARIAKANVVA